MSISNIQSNGYASQWDSIKQQRRQDFQAVAQSLQSGDLAGAKKAFSAFQQDIQNGPQGLQGGQQPMGLPQSSQGIGLGSSSQGFAALLQQMQSGQTTGNNNSDIAQLLSGKSNSGSQDLLTSLLSPSTQNNSSDPMAMLQALAAGGMSNPQSMMAGLLQQMQGDQNQSAATVSGVNPANPRQQIQALSQALASGNLTAAQQVMANIQQSAPEGQNGQDPATTINNDMQAVQKALDSNDVAGAKSAMATMAKDMQAARQAYQSHRGHHAHHHHGGNNGNGETNNSSPGLGITSTSTSSSTGGSDAATLTSLLSVNTTA